MQRRQSSSLLQVPILTNERKAREKSPIRRSKTPTRSQSRERVTKTTKKSSSFQKQKIIKENILSSEMNCDFEKEESIGAIRLSPFTINRDCCKTKEPEKPKNIHLKKRNSIIEPTTEDLLQANLLITAILKNDYTLLRKLIITDERNVNERSYEHATALHVASAAGYFECVILLLECGANVDLKDDNSRTPLEYAVLYGHFDCASELVKYGADTKVIKDGIAI